MPIQKFISRLDDPSEFVEFCETMSVIDDNYVFTPVNFQNGDVHNLAGQNSGSCKIFAFGLLNQLSEAHTLACFGEYYRNDVLNNPNADDHANIRSFMKHGWSAISFSQNALALVYR